MINLSKIAVLALGAEILSLRNQSEQNASLIANLQAELTEVSESGVFVLTDDSIGFEGLFIAAGERDARIYMDDNVTMLEVIESIPVECQSKMTIINDVIASCNETLTTINFNDSESSDALEVQKVAVDDARLALVNSMTDGVVTADVLDKRNAYMSEFITYKQMYVEYVKLSTISSSLNELKDALSAYVG